MWKCQQCGQLAYWGASHVCPANQYQPVYYYVPTEQLQPTLERIAKALETLAEQKKIG